MKILLDECVDWRLARELTQHEVVPVHRHGWAGLKNGELLRNAESEFDVFLTVDRNLSFQQSVTGRKIAVVVLQARTNRLADLRTMVPDLLVALESVQIGVVTHVGT